MYIGVLQDAHRGILFRFAKHIDEKSQNIAAGRVRGLRVNSYAASIAMATLLVLLVIGGVEPHPGPTDDKIANGKRDSTSSANDGNHTTGATPFPLQQSTNCLLRSANFRKL